MTARVWTALIAAAVGTYVIRASFLVVARRMGEVGPVATAILRMIPPAALAGLVLPALVAPDGAVDLPNPRLVAGIVAAIAGWWSRQTLVTLGAGLGTLLLWEAIAG